MADATHQSAQSVANRAPRPPTGLQLGKFNPGIDDHDIACNCDNGRPENGDAVMVCVVCNKWIHLECNVAINTFQQSEVDSGYRCRACTSRLRSQAVRKGHDAAAARRSSYQAGTIEEEAAANRRNHTAKAHCDRQLLSSAMAHGKDNGKGTSVRDAQDTTCGARPASPPIRHALEAANAPASGKRRPVSRPLRCFVNNLSPVNGSGSLPVQTLWNRPVTMKRKRDVESNSGKDEDDEDDDVPKNIDVSQTRFRPVRALSSGQVVPRAGSAVEVIEEWKNSTTRPMILCDCDEDEMSRSIFDYIICEACKRLQHKACMLGNMHGEGIAKGTFCKDCRGKEIQERCQSQARVLQVAKSLISEETAKIRAFCQIFLWKQYCLLPNGQATPAMLELTRIHYDREKLEPVHPAPHGWTVAMLISIQSMILKAGSAKEIEYFGQGVHYNEHYLARLRELAVWMLHRGPYRRDRKQLGVVAEVLGLEAKGTFWSYQ